MSKTITNHPAVAECLLDGAGGCDYKYDTFLKEGWVYLNGRMAGARGGNFDTVAEFRYASPVTIEEYQAITGDHSERI